jgi:hypothetical protein
LGHQNKTHQKTEQ